MFAGLEVRRQFLWGGIWEGGKWRGTRSLREGRKSQKERTDEKAATAEKKESPESQIQPVSQVAPCKFGGYFIPYIGQYSYQKYVLSSSPSVGRSFGENHGPNFGHLKLHTFVLQVMRVYRRLIEFGGPPMWQAKADTVCFACHSIGPNSVNHGEILGMCWQM